MEFDLDYTKLAVSLDLKIMWMTLSGVLQRQT